ncbi:outer membrane beta-barrel protein [Vogesella mureinivorans]|uniref:outer membrane beta-barrel protein n=1 Tax=Vogesella mureinivorans TaxID=657276 RepID=UPI0014791457|nr:outer membrane beta-barrel protein [Vogesella mureinivorans]
MYKLTPMALALSLLSGYAVAQSAPNAAIPQQHDIYKSFDTYKPNEQADPDGAMRVGNFFLYPRVGVSVGHDDNVTAVNSKKVSSAVWNLSPAALLERTNGGDRYTLGYSGSYTQYANSSNDNTDLHEFQGQAAVQYDDRLNTLFRAGVLLSADPRETTDRASAAKPDEFRNSYTGYLVGYGAPEAQGRLEAEINYNNKRYTNNRATTADGDFAALDTAGRFYYRVAPNSKVFVEGRYTDYDYKLASPDQDSTEQRVLLGVTWEATAATQGTVKAGNLKKDFAQASRRDFSGLTWEGAVRWSPVEYSVVDLNTRRATDDSSGTGDYIKRSSYGLQWNHKLTDLFSTVLGYTYTDSKYVGATRHDKNKSYKAGVAYDARRWMKVSLEWTTADNNSTVQDKSFKRNVIMLNTLIGL